MYSTDRKHCLNKLIYCGYLYVLCAIIQKRKIIIKRNKNKIIKCIKIETESRAIVCEMRIHNANANTVLHMKYIEIHLNIPFTLSSQHSTLILVHKTYMIHTLNSTNEQKETKKNQQRIYREQKTQETANTQMNICEYV